MCKVPRTVPGLLIIGVQLIVIIICDVIITLAVSGNFPAGRAGALELSLAVPENLFH